MDQFQESHTNPVYSQQQHLGYTVWAEAGATEAPQSTSEPSWYGQNLFQHATLTSNNSFHQTTTIPESPDDKKPFNYSELEAALLLGAWQPSSGHLESDQEKYCTNF